jgi:hypothetical protein
MLTLTSKPLTYPACCRSKADYRGRGFFELPLNLQLEYLPLLNEWFIREYRDKIGALLRHGCMPKLLLANESLLYLERRSCTFTLKGARYECLALGSPCL